MERVPFQDLEALSVERVCEEFRKAMRSNNPRRFFYVLDQTTMLPIHFGELADLRGVPAGPPEHHGEGDSFVHTLMVLDQAVALGGDEVERVSALLHDLGKALTPKHRWPKHYGHDVAGV